VPKLRDDYLDTALPSRLASTHPRFDEVRTRHQRAVAAGLPAYADPLSGFSVFTAQFLAQRQYCCTSGCRHCPYELDET